MISPKNNPPCYSLFAFVHLPADHLPPSGSSLKIEYYAGNTKNTVCEKVKHVIFTKILTPEQDSKTELASQSEWGILGFEENSTSSKCDELASELLKQPTCIVTVSEMQQSYSNIIVTPSVYHEERE